jgi:hypothetical protein
LTPAEVRLAKDSLEAVRSLAQNLRTLKEQIEAVAKENKARGEANEPKYKPPPTLHTELQLPQAIQAYYATAQHSERGKRRREWAALAINLLTLLAVVAYASITFQMQTAMVETVKEAKRANGLQARLTKGTYGVTFDAQADVSSDGSIGLIFTNRGKVMSASLHATGKIVLETLPGYEPIGTPVPITVSGEQIDVGRIAMSRVHFDQLTKAHVDRIAQWREAVSIQGTVNYDNGFGDEVSSTFCFLDVRWATGDGQLVMRPLLCDIAKETVRIGPGLLRAAKKK